MFPRSNTTVVAIKVDTKEGIKVHQLVRTINHISHLFITETKYTFREIGLQATEDDHINVFSYL
jgi:hypothetical protein